MARKNVVNDDEEVIASPITKRTKTYNPSDRRAKSSSKSFDKEEEKGKKYREPDFNQDRRRKGEPGGVTLALFWGLLITAILAFIILWQKDRISEFTQKVFNTAYAWVGWGLVLIMAAVLVAIAILQRRALHDLFVNKLRVRLWHWWIGGIILVFAVWGILGLFDLGGHIGKAIVGNTIGINYLRVVALFIIGFMVLLPKLTWKILKNLYHSFVGMFQSDGSEKEEKKKKKVQGGADQIYDVDSPGQPYTPSYNLPQSAYNDQYAQPMYGYAQPQQSQKTPQQQYQQKPAAASQTRNYATGNSPVITGRTAVAREKIDYQPAKKPKYSGLDGFVDPRKYQEAERNAASSAKPSAPKTSGPAPNSSSKYGTYGFVNTAAPSSSYSSTSPSRADAPVERPSVNFNDYQFAKPQAGSSYNPYTPASSAPSGSYQAPSAPKTDYANYQPASNTPKTDFANYKPSNSANPYKPSSSKAGSGFKSSADTVSSQFLPIDFKRDSAIKKEEEAAKAASVDTPQKKTVKSNPYLSPEDEEKAELQAEIESNKASGPYTPVMSPTIGPDPENWRPNLDAIAPCDDGWKLPTTDLLVPSEGPSFDEEDNQHRADILEEALASYGVDARVVAINPGPTITQFGVEPGFEYKINKVKTVDEEGNPIIVEEKIPGKRIKVDKIKNLADDLALALQAPSIRIEAPVPNQSYVGIEIPNKVYSMVSLRSNVESDSFRKISAKSKLAIALGQGSSGEFVSADLAKMPHVLIAGATGSGKTVCLNALICCLLMNNTPTELKIIMVDPKRVEMTQYRTIPHLLTPVIVEPDKAMAAMRWLQMEMENRLKIMEKAHARNIAQYNEGRVGTERMPNIVLIIDELADLMMTGFSECETILARLAQLARAVGIHLVVATQRPSVDVITGLIKNNFPTRISFAVTSYVDSKTILDMAGAEKLLGHGDMLYSPQGVKPMRLQGCYVSDAEIDRLVYFWGQQNGPNTPMIDLTTVPIPAAAGGASKNTPNEDPLMPKVRELAKTTKITTSLLQRKLNIGYPRAARLNDRFQEEFNDMDGGAEVPDDDDDEYGY
jgi:DNA segregation ATPase FtsK/SpoIIIE-like protein